VQKKLHIIIFLAIITITAYGVQTWYNQMDNDPIVACTAGNYNHEAPVGIEEEAEPSVFDSVSKEDEVNEDEKEPDIEAIKTENKMAVELSEAPKQEAPQPDKDKQKPVVTQVGKTNTEKKAAAGGSPKVTYTTYKVQQGDTFWNIAEKTGIPMPELLEINKMNDTTVLYVGMTLSVPQYHIPSKSTPGPKYGELLDWWTEVQYIWPIGVEARVIDFATGKSFNVRRSYGAFHADAEPLSTADSGKMKEIWGGWSWTTRPVIVEVNGRRIAASSHAMPHSIQTITDNGFDGHFCIHFLNSTRHKDNQMQADHQQNIRTAAGL
jgi:LysM repeat protein